MQPFPHLLVRSLCTPLPPSLPNGPSDIEATSPPDRSPMTTPLAADVTALTTVAPVRAPAEGGGAGGGRGGCRGSLPCCGGGVRVFPQLVV